MGVLEAFERHSSGILARPRHAPAGRELVRRETCRGEPGQVQDGTASHRAAFLEACLLAGSPGGLLTMHPYFVWCNQKVSGGTESTLRP